MCLYEREIKNQRYNPRTAKNKAIAERLGIPEYSPVCPDERLLSIKIGCGNCMECRKQEQLKWLVRLSEEIKHSPNGKFIALTLSNESIKKICEEETIQRRNKETGNIDTLRIGDLQGYDRDNQIATKALRRFNERWRKKHKKALRHWAITELGHQGTENIHIHALVFTSQSFQEIRDRWQYGWIYPRPHEEHKNRVTLESVGYITKYITKRDQRHKEYKGVILCSPGIGKQYITDRTEARHAYNGTKTIEAYKTSTGHEINLPAYYRNKIYQEEQKEDLWIQKLNKEIKYICGEKVSTKDPNAIQQVQQWYRRVNHELGYGQLPNDNRRIEEEKIRETMHNKRLMNSQGINKNKGNNEAS